MSARATKEQLAALAEFGACDVSDALTKLKCPHSGYIPDLDIHSPGPDKQETTKIVGEAFTVKFVEGSNTEAPKASQQYVDAADEGSIMVVQMPPNCKNAVWGGLMTARAQYKGIKGVIIDGRCRDLREHREAGFPIFARGHSIIGQSPYVRPSTLQESITIKPTVSDANDTSSFPSITVNPYDVIVADLDGVVAFPPKDIDEVLRLCKKGVEVDGRCMEDIKKGKGIADAFKEHRGKYHPMSRD